MSDNSVDESPWRNPQRHCMTVEQQQELARFINRNSLENGCNMPDFAIAAYLAQCYQALCIAAESHVDWSLLGDTEHA